MQIIDSYHLSSSTTSWFWADDAAWRTWIMCVNKVLHTPSSNSCIKSTTSICDTLTPLPRRSQNVFWWGCGELWREVSSVPDNSYKRWHQRHWLESFFNSCSHDWNCFVVDEGTSSCARSRMYVLSIFWGPELLCHPIRSSFTLGVRHLGQGHKPLSRIVANKTLMNGFSMNKGTMVGKCTSQDNRQSKWRTVDRHGVQPHQNTW